MPTVFRKAVKHIGNNSWMSSPGVTFNLTFGKGVTELQNLANLRLSSFAESHQMQENNFDVSPITILTNIIQEFRSYDRTSTWQRAYLYAISEVPLSWGGGINSINIEPYLFQSATHT